MSHYLVFTCDELVRGTALRRRLATSTLRGRVDVSVSTRWLCRATGVWTETEPIVRVELVTSEPADAVLRDTALLLEAVRAVGGRWLDADGVVMDFGPQPSPVRRSIKAIR